MKFAMPSFAGESVRPVPVQRSNMLEYDQALAWVVILLMLLGIVMVYSASISLPDSPKYAKYQTWNFLLRQTVFVGVSIVVALFTVRIPVKTWQRAAPYLFVATLVLLALVLVPGIGKGVNGAKRWLSFKVFNLQPSEMMKLFVVLYAADYTVRKQQFMHKLTKGFLPMAGAVGAVIMLSPWRRERIFAYLNPWEEENALGKAYQLSHSLIAFGRGELFGVGLGGSVEKLHYLPEAHTDFLLAVIGEELGFVGVMIVILMFYWIVKRAFEIGRQAIAMEQTFAGLTAKGIGIWIGVQTFINMGVNLGLLPTKGLTLPLMSYGGSGVLINCIGIAILLRIDYENRLLMRGGRV
jgi:cell division protein FtsW